MNEESKLVENEQDTPASRWQNIQKSSQSNGNMDRNDEEMVEREDELFSQHQKDQSVMFGIQWWKGNFFLSEPTQFGTWDGVFTSCMINIFGVLIFLRIGWMVGYAGVACSLIIIAISSLVAFIALTSAVGIYQRCYLDQGGIYFLINHVLGTRVAAPVGILYCFGQGVACALYVVGFGESIATLIRSENLWVARGIATLLLFLLLAINIVGVKWVIRFQLILLATITAAVLDFLIGSFVSTKPEFGILGYNWKNFMNNLGPDDHHDNRPLSSLNSSGYSYLPDTNINFSSDKTGFFAILGVFFPAVTGVFAGINMSGDLRHPSRSIPTGSFAALGISVFMYAIFVLVLGLTCLRSTLQLDFLIAEKVSGSGLILMCGLYVSSISSGTASLYGPPKILQCIAQDNAFPFLSFLAKSKEGGHPYIALVSIATISVIFIVIGSINMLGPIVAVPFIFSYAAVDWAHFSLVTSYHRREKWYSSLDEIPSADCYGAVDGKVDDDDTQDEYKRINSTIAPLPKSCYSPFCNRWLSLLGSIISLLGMVCIQWFYSLIICTLFIVMYSYILLSNPTVFEGISEFGLKNMVKNLLKRYRKRHESGEESQMVIPNDPLPTHQVTTAEITEPNEDYQDRDPYHKVQDVDTSQFF